MEYRLAPEHPFPAGVEDCVDAFRWVRGNRTRFGLSHSTVGVGGESAGANLAAVVSQECKDDPEGGPVLGCLVFPATDLSRRRQSHEDFGTGFLLTTERMEWYIGRT